LQQREKKMNSGSSAVTNGPVYATANGINGAAVAEISQLPKCANEEVSTYSIESFVDYETATNIIDLTHMTNGNDYYKNTYTLVNATTKTNNLYTISPTINNDLSNSLNDTNDYNYLDDDESQVSNKDLIYYLYLLYS
jgi:hypothetical protein